MFLLLFVGFNILYFGIFADQNEAMRSGDSLSPSRNTRPAICLLPQLLRPLTGVAPKASIARPLKQRLFRLVIRANMASLVGQLTDLKSPSGRCYWPLMKMIGVMPGVTLPAAWYETEISGLREAVTSAFISFASTDHGCTLISAW